MPTIPALTAMQARAIVAGEMTYQHHLAMEMMIKMTEKSLKCRLTRASGESMMLAWNVTDYEMNDGQGYIQFWHDKGEVIHYFAPGDTITMLEQYNPENDHEND